MKPTPAASEPQPDLRAEDASHHRLVLNGLIDLGAELARLVVDDAKAQIAAEAPSPGVATDAAQAYDQITRSVRRGIMLVQVLHNPAPPPAAASAHASTAARKAVLRGVEDKIQREARGEDAELLHAELLERLDSPDIEDDIATRPVADIIREIAHDLGLDRLGAAHPWKRRTPEDVAELHARAARLPVPPRPEPGTVHRLHRGTTPANDAAPLSDEELVRHLLGPPRLPGD